MSDVYLNRRFVGTVDDGQRLVQAMKEERRKDALPSNLNVYYDEKSDDVFIENERGRVRRPLIIVRNGQPLLTEKHIIDRKSVV